MTTFSSSTEVKIKKWLENLFESEDFRNCKFSIVEVPEDGGGYIGNVVFTEVSGTTKQGIVRTHNLVLKCSKDSKALREKTPVKEAYLNEIYFYNSIFPSFEKFQQERQVKEPFENVPKCYGTLTTNEAEIIALEDLKCQGYILLDMRKPLSRRHVDLVIKEYGKFHAISTAMKEQEPKKFLELTNRMEDIYGAFVNKTGLITTIEDNVQDTYDMLKNDLSEQVLKEWLKLKPKAGPFLKHMCQDLDTFNVITHADCWNNNFLFYHVDDEPLTLRIIDWQMQRYSSPIFELSYFFFTCLSKEDMEEIPTFLDSYYKYFKDHLDKLGNSAQTLYPKEQFLEDWKKYALFGPMISLIIQRTAYTEKEDAPDIIKTVENGEDFAKTFSKPFKKTNNYKERMKYLVEYVVEKEIIKNAV